DRAVGYFTSDSLSLVLEGIEQLIKNNGKMRIVTSPMLSEKDIKALKQVNDIDVINFKIEDEIKKFYLTKSSDITKLFSWLISKEILEIKIAYQKNLTGIYHEKFGIFKDFNENY
ncbi:DNA phosphorothioation system restriction enzyme, partial [Fusobacterium mortiferum]|nr:DNA phosphorothioation system restriction enzyme [Fusobacterium mortiferum]